MSQPPPAPIPAPTLNKGSEINFAEVPHETIEYCPDLLSGYSHSSGTISYDSIPEVVGRDGRTFSSDVDRAEFLRIVKNKSQQLREAEPVWQGIGYVAEIARTTDEILEQHFEQRTGAIQLNFSVTQSAVQLKVKKTRKSSVERHFNEDTAFKASPHHFERIFPDPNNHVPFLKKKNVDD
ncbi:unnamed protein product [Caenorhabditis auriculariae]|uniref:Uncharacterized protein n=1 Tax=Caenorhabditis auriculariae TaxID=2777116 RepID=A0A8S1H5B9_9PELO|nr:unnamed protein product [Caenorhabditis auriculariae]